MEPFSQPSEWRGQSRDPNDEQLADVATRTSLADADAYGTVIVGEPYDGGHTLGRPGARTAPEHLRRALAGTKTHYYGDGPIRSVGDLGDVTFPHGQTVADTQSALGEATERVHDVDALPVFLGGDHSLAYPNVAPLLDRHDSVGVINLDSHADVRERIDGQPHTGTPFRQLYERGLAEYVQVGARGFGLSTPYVDYLEEKGATVLTAETVADDLGGAVDTALAAMADVDAVYVSFDVDVLDATTAPGTSSAEPGGLFSREVNQLLRSLAEDERVCGLGVYEFSPMLDDNGTTARAAARAVAHFLIGCQRR
jgi:formiminoglutamase/agmatinase